MLTDSERYDLLPQKIQALKQEIGKRVIGQHEVIENMLIALFSNGNCLFIGVPGLAKTLLVNTVAQSVGLDFGRVQFTPDLLPADITGSEILQQDKMTGERTLSFIKGPVFTNLLLADEINRTPPKTQAALLQAMQEKEVTIAGQNWQLGSPFHVLATQNPIEQEGTYPLPEAQLDRFLLEIQVQYPDRMAEKDILLATTGVEEPALSSVFASGQILEAQNLIRRIPVGDSVVELILDLVRTFRPEDPSANNLVRENMRWGPGPRASQALMLAIRSQALLRGDLAPSVADVALLAPAILNHRMAMGFAARSQGMTQLELIDEVTGSVIQKSAVA